MSQPLPNRRIAHLTFAAFLLALSALAPLLSAATCESLASLALPNTTITAQDVPAGAFTPPGGQPIKDLPAFCRVTGSIKPSAESDIHFEVWMPSSGWNRKFKGVGNGGFAGSIGYGFGGLATALAQGYATASTDTGHTGSAAEAGWALKSPEKIVDFGYRAIHLMTENAKAIIRAFYGEAPKRSYFGSCSNGGRQALMEAQRFPADYDGILAGAPANFWTHHISGFIWDMQAISAASYIPANKIPAIEAAAIAACDALDGVKDGIIDDPTKCHFDPQELLCKGTESASCLTEPQVAALKKIYAGPRNSRGEQIFPGYLPGGESGSGGWPLWITGSAPEKSLQFAFETQFFRNMLFNDPAWDYRTYQFDRDLKFTDDKMAHILNAMDPNLKPFQDRGGKLILYHGWSDAAIPPVNSINYYQRVSEKMGSKQTGSFVRLYMVPGMQHCFGGPGPNSFGEFGPGGTDAMHDVSQSLERWVEDGVAPNEIIATKYKNDLNPASGVVRTRPLCPYPQVAHWKGTGSTDDAANFDCKLP